MPNISERILILPLREMERDGLINRIVCPEVPACVEYLLTPLGKSWMRRFPFSANREKQTALKHWRRLIQRS
ncbi:winged helix-turn-helix transcriptional regulator [Dyadobacter pollutisoli]|uniref:Winged helix-turn-helix transcriptional regulator n=1 Tax=Dyadobacter pollutisoli TaxID=2910158 RepID=A0A9E8SPK0_9BACT|nr:winged helix-turn-helix transcriptional regulator [Dyadobacter pollutisoli]WAC15419.1 winged helix-turn-helix transcriptional regulator [Dyadobacter pollutisoli]